jgi:hypothetical protein
MTRSIEDWLRLLAQIYANVEGARVKLQESANIPHSERDSLNLDSSLVQMIDFSFGKMHAIIMIEWRVSNRLGVNMSGNKSPSTCP